MKRENKMVLCEVLHRATQAVADLVDEYEVDDDTVYTLTSRFEDLASECLGVPKPPMTFTGRGALDQLLGDLEKRGDIEDQEQG